jgi:thioredoxin 1
MGVPEFDDNNFDQEVLQSSKPVLVDFWAPWCGPCRMIAPVIEELAQENAGNIKIGKLNTDQGQSTAMRYHVDAIPTLIFFKNGQEVDRIQGVKPKSRLQETIDSLTA